MPQRVTTVTVLSPTMTEISWKALMRERSARHLLVGSVTDDEATGGAASLKVRTALLARLARALRLAEFYAIVDLPARSGHEIRCALAREADAVKLADAVGAEAAPAEPDWASVRRFRFDAAAEAAITATLQSRASIRRTRKKRASNVL